MTFDPSEQRDANGRWTAGGTSATISVKPENIETAKYVADAVNEVAAKLKYDPALINITDEPRTFTVNGKAYNEGGHCTLADKRISIFQGPFWTKESVQGVTAHEIMHAKFETFRDDYQAEYARMTEATKGLDVDAFMKPNGLLKGEWADKFPFYQKYTEAMMPDITDDFAKSDGITPYSEDYWDAWKKPQSEVPTYIAMHETLAEMGRLHFQQGKIVAPPGIKKGEDIDGKPTTFLTGKYASKSWTDLYNAVNEHWDSNHK